MWVVKIWVFKFEFDINYIPIFPNKNVMKHVLWNTQYFLFLISKWYFWEYVALCIVEF